MGYPFRYLLQARLLISISLKHSRKITRLACNNSSTEESITEKNATSIRIDEKTIRKLERISLVDFGNEGGIERLEAVIRFAQKLKEVKLSSSTKPMYSVLENEKLELREDKVTEGNCRNEILKNSKLLEDEYFVAPPGNIPKSLKTG